MIREEYYDQMNSMDYLDQKIKMERLPYQDVILLKDEVGYFYQKKH